MPPPPSWGGFTVPSQPSTPLRWEGTPANRTPGVAVLVGVPPPLWQHTDQPGERRLKEDTRYGQC